MESLSIYGQNLYVCIKTGKVMFSHELDRLFKNKFTRKLATTYFEIIEGVKISRRSRREALRKITKLKLGKRKV